MSEMPSNKNELRAHLRELRREHAAALPQEVSALVFRGPPGPVRTMVPEGAVIGLYRATDGEAPASGYARFFAEAGHQIALPRIEAMDGAMTFHAHSDPYGEADLEEGPVGLMQPAADSPQLVPDVLFVPLVGFTADGARLGQGGGFYDRWLADHPETLAIGMAWDVQEVDSLPVEDHDVPLTAIITTTRVLGPFERADNA